MMGLHKIYIYAFNKHCKDKNNKIGVSTNNNMKVYVKKKHIVQVKVANTMKTI